MAEWIRRLGAKRNAPRETVLECMETGEAAKEACAPQAEAPLPDEGLHKLTPKERAVLDLLLEGCTMKQAAQRLGVAYSTVNTHTNAIYRKLQVNSRAQLILAYHRIVRHETES